METLPVPKTLLGVARLLAFLGLAACTAPFVSSPMSSTSRLDSATSFIAGTFPQLSDSTQITNQYLPMVPDTTYIYDGSKGRTPEQDTVYTTHDTKTIIGIPCVIQIDTGYLNGKIVEKTFDYFAQDANGNVWYFGEYATQYRNGKVTGHQGSWISGKHKAQPGVVMEANPRVGDQNNQENAPRVAEDKARVLSLTSSVHTNYVNYIGNVLETKEFSPLDPPGSGEHKWYEPGIGFMKSEDIHPGPQREVLSLTAIEDEK
jgi:hypothetical protein